MQEEWRIIEEAPNYEVSNLGNVRNKKLKKPVRPFTNNAGYLQVVIRSNKKNLYRLVHRLVAIAFIPNPNGYSEINHKDFNKDNNTVENLEWVSHTMNMKYNIHRLTSEDKLISLITKEVSKVIRDNIKRYVQAYADDQ
jgi:hypothetical protein